MSLQFQVAEVKLELNKEEDEEHVKDVDRIICFARLSEDGRCVSALQTAGGLGRKALKRESHSRGKTHMCGSARHSTRVALS